MSARKLKLGPDYQKAHTRIASLQGIDENLDLGGGSSLVNYKAVCQELQDTYDAYNHLVNELAEIRIRYKQQVRKVRDWNKRMLAGVVARFGNDSAEYEQCGGTRTSNRRKAAKNGGPAA